jgi:uncharacterized protein
MNELFDTISADIKTAMLAREKVALEALRGIKKEFIEAKTAKGSDGNLADDVAVKILQKMVKQRKESAQIFAEQNRPELAENELAEAAVIEKYLPTQMTDAELTAAVSAVIAQVGATGPQDMGKVMGIASKQLAGKTEGRLISEKVKALLAASEIYCLILKQNASVLFKIRKRSFCYSKRILYSSSVFFFFENFS